jgi:hypothetical protein
MKAITSLFSTFGCKGPLDLSTTKSPTCYVFYSECIELLANWAAILTAMLASSATVVYWYDRCKKQRRLEHYLFQEKSTGGDEGQRSLLHLSRNLLMTEDDILRAAFGSKKIEPRTRQNEQTGLAEHLLLVHK